ncbi:MAG: Bpu10I family restriction endonuclease [Phycisphaerae bacterium]|nr:Bpu10I family restriction endonuclease [Phycisphaerae bacterium]
MTAATIPTPHLDKLNAACANAKCSAEDKKLIARAKQYYAQWVAAMHRLTATGRDRVNKMVALLNEYKDALEIDLIARQGSPFLKRQKGQLKLDNSVLEEFLPHLLSPKIITGLNHTRFQAGPQQAFMSLSFMPSGFEQLGKKPEVVVKVKDQDFAIGSTIHYKFSADPAFSSPLTAAGHFALAVLAAEVKVNLDKTMFQEAAGTAARLKQGCPVARYFLLVEYLDMTPEDPRLTSVDNVYLLRKTKRLPFGRRDKAHELEMQHKAFPISTDVVWEFTRQIQIFVDAVWYDPDGAICRGAFI